MLKQIEQTTLPYPLEALAQAVRALPVKLTEAQASQALDPVLKQIGQTDSFEFTRMHLADPFVLAATAKALQALAGHADARRKRPKRSNYCSGRSAETTDPAALHALAAALQVLTPKLSNAQAAEASKAAASSLAWSAVALGGG